MGNYGKKHTAYNGIVLWLKDYLKVTVPENNKTFQHLEQKAINRVIKAFLESATQCVPKKNIQSNVDKVHQRFNKFTTWAKENKEKVQNLLNE